MTLQRRRLGAKVAIYGLVKQSNWRGEERIVVDLSAPIATPRAWLIADADRFQSMDIEGKQEIVMFEMGVADHPMFHTRDVASDARVYWDGYWWDVVHPPKQARGATRHVRHWRLSLRRRPLSPDEPTP